MHDLALVADDWWRMTVAPPEKQLSADSSQRPRNTTIQLIPKF